MLSDESIRYQYFKFPGRKKKKGGQGKKVIFIYSQEGYGREEWLTERRRK